MRDLVLDSWPVMAWLKGQEPTATLVRSVLDAASRRECRLYINIMNVGEIFYLTAKLKNLAFAQQVVDGLRQRMSIVSASDDLVMQAATLKAQHKLSYADAFAAATAISEKLPLMTGDGELKEAASNNQALKLEWIG
jgi:predicted nucleic acid-binding protein